MRGLWSESNWRLDHDALILPNQQRIALALIRDWREQQVTGNVDLAGQWRGWRVRQQWLIPPGGSMRRFRISERYARHLAQAEDWERTDISRRQLALF